MILARLKEDTRQQHEELERVSVLKPLSEGELSKEEYILILEKFYSFFSPLESQILKFQLLHDFLPDQIDRRKSHWILKDIESFKVNTASIKVCTQLPSLDTAGKALGALYVMEGSTLGGTIIAKRIKDLLHLENEGVTFFDGYKKDTGLKWKAFREGVSSFVNQHPEAEYEVVESAKDTFNTFKNWLNQKE